MTFKCKNKNKAAVGRELPPFISKDLQVAGSLKIVPRKGAESKLCRLLFSRIIIILF